MWTPFINSNSFRQTLTNYKSRTVSGWLQIGLNLHERMWINQKRHTFELLAVRVRVLLQSLVLPFFSFSAGLSPRSSHDTSLTSRASSAEAVPAHLAPFSTKRMDREFERKLQEVFVSVQLEKVRKIYTILLLTRWSVSSSSVLKDGSRAIMIFLLSQQFTTIINDNLFLQRPIWS